MALLTLAAGCTLDFTKKPAATDGGADGSASGGGENGSGQAVDGASPGGTDSSVPDASPATPDCTEDEDCGDLVRFECVEEKCSEYECYAGKACPDGMCEGNTCVAFTPPERFPTGYFQSSGGGTSASSQYRLRLSAGMPQPMGVMTSGMYRMTIGPGAGRP